MKYRPSARNTAPTTRPNSDTGNTAPHHTVEKGMSHDSTTPTTDRDLHANDSTSIAAATETNTEIKTVGIVGVGKLGTALGQLAAAAGLKILATSRPSPMRDMIISTVLPTATIVNFDELAERADVVLLAVPNTAVASFDLSCVRGTVIDATNPWEATGTASDGSVTTTDLATKFPGTHIAKTLNHVSYEELISDYRTAEDLAAGSPRRAIAVFSIDDHAATVAEHLVDVFGFAPVRLPTSTAPRFRPDGDLFGVWLSADEMRAKVREAE